MELDQVHTMAESVVGAQFGQMPVGLTGQGLQSLAADQGAGAVQVGLGPAGAECLDRLGERLIPRERVVVLQRARLVQHVMRGVAR